MTWTLRSEVLPAGGAWADLDRAHASGPSVLQDDDDTFRMWYSGHDGSTGRILTAVQHRGRGWERLGIAIDAGAAGDSDEYGVESPCVVRTPGGYLMAYAGSDGADTRLHMATSPDGEHWDAQGTFMQRGEPDSVGATHPCLVVTEGRWWLFYAGYDGQANGRRSSILGAVSANGASWDRVGVVMAPEPGELAVSEPWVVIGQRHFSMFYVSDDAQEMAIELATSDDGLAWDRRGTTLSPHDAGGCNVQSPCALRLRDHTMRLWYAAPAPLRPEPRQLLWFADLAGNTL